MWYITPCRLNYNAPEDLLEHLYRRLHIVNNLVLISVEGVVLRSSIRPAFFSFFLSCIS
jgi:hypothetical protein